MQKVLSGTRVNVVGLDGEDMTQGTIMLSFVQDGDDNDDVRIRLDDGRVVSGRECFWLPTRKGRK